MFKRIAAGITAAVVFASFYGQGLVSEADEAGEAVLNKDGNWDTGLQGYRFSLVNADGDVEKIVDVWDYSIGYTNTFDGEWSYYDNPASKRPDGIHSPQLNARNVEEILKYGNIEHDNSKVFSSSRVLVEKTYFYAEYSAEYMVFNKCKLELAQGASNTSQTMSELCFDSSEYWYVADHKDVFTHSKLNLDDNFSSKMVKFEPNRNSFWLCKWESESYKINGSVYNGGDNFIKYALLGNQKDTEEKDDVWLGICDVLAALGIDVYEGVGDYSTDNGKRKIYNNLVDKFVSKEYCVVVEPLCMSYMQYIPTPLKDKKNKETGEVNIHVTFCYGSATELAIYEQEVDKKLWLNVITSGLMPKAMYVTDDYNVDLERYSKGTLKCVNETDWDYYDWQGDLPEAVAEKIKKDPGYDYLKGIFQNGGIDNDSFKGDGYIRKSRRNNSHYSRYTPNFMRHYACAMAMITSSDFIKPQVATQDYDYHTSTDVISSVRVSNRSSTEYTTDISAESFTPETIKNGAGVPQAMVCKFSLISVLDESGTIPVFTTDLEISEQAEKKFAELGFAKDENGEYICEFYGSLDGLASKDEVLDNGYGASYISFEWKTPEKPCTVTFRAEFLDANLSPEAVLGTAEKDGKRATEVKSDDGRFTTEFECRINDDIEKNILNEDTVPPDSVSIISVKPAESASADEWERYKTNLDIYNDYTDKFGSDANRFTEADYMGMTSESSLSWTEYTAAYRAGTADIEITAVNHTVTAAVTNDESAAGPDGTAKVIRTDASGLYEPYSDSIGSGYGIGVNFISSLTADTTGNSYERDLTVNGRSYKNTLVTNYGRGAVLFPEYDYEKYYGEVICTDDSDPFAAEYSLISNENSLYYEEPSESEDKLAAEIAQDKRSRIHFTPVWYPDGEYEIALCMFDAWTPAGELRLCRTASVTISGSLYDTWYVTRTANNQKRG